MAIASFIVSGLASIASALITGGINKSQTEKASAEDLRLSELQANDLISSEKKDLNLRQQELNFNKSIFKQNQNLTNKQEQQTVGEQTLNNTKAAASKLFNTDDQSYLYKSKLLGRFSV
jgi:hypothetical protein